MNMDERLFICDNYKDCDYNECFHLTAHVHDSTNCDTTCSCYCSSKCVDFLVLQRRDKLDKLGRSSLKLRKMRKLKLDELGRSLGRLS